MIRTFKYRIYANQQTLNKASNWLELCRNLYNCALQQRVMTYKQNRKLLSYHIQQHELVELKSVFPEYKYIGSHVLQNVLNRLDMAFKSFFRNGHGFPRYKGNNRYDSFTFPDKAGWKLQYNYLYIAKIGAFKLHLSRPIKGDIKTVTIKRSATNKWFIYFSCNNVLLEKNISKLDNAIGLDVGIKSFLVDSEGNKVENPLYMRQAEAILRRKQRALSRKKKGSNRRHKARLLVAKAYEKITNQRLDFLHKLANKYIQNYGTIVVEDLPIQNMIRNHQLAKSISDVSWSRFFKLLSYKAEEAGRKVIKVKPHNTSQNCSRCGNKVEKTLAVRVHSCPFCGLVMDRDENAARNILRLGRSLQPLTCASTQCVG